MKHCLAAVHIKKSSCTLHACSRRSFWCNSATRCKQGMTSPTANKWVFNVSSTIGVGASPAQLPTIHATPVNSFTQKSHHADPRVVRIELVCFTLPKSRACIASQRATKARRPFSAPPTGETMPPHHVCPLARGQLAGGSGGQTRSRCTKRFCFFVCAWQMRCVRT